MSEQAEKRVPTKNLERIGEKKFDDYEAAKRHQGSLVQSEQWPIAKSKIFARRDGTFDVVWYKKIQKEEPKPESGVSDKKTGKEAKRAPR